MSYVSAYSDEEAQRRKKVLKEARAHVKALEKECHHHLRPLTEKEKNDEWMSVEAQCLICGKSFGWRCQDSPDGVCHYHTSGNGKDPDTGIPRPRVVWLIDGTPVSPPEIDLSHESYDWCLYCNMPDERQ